MVKASTVRENGGNATEHTGIETSKSPRLVGIQHQGGEPQKAKEAAWGPGGGEKSQGTASQLCRPALLPISLLAAQSLVRLQLSRPPREVLVASKHLNIA